MDEDLRLSVDGVTRAMDRYRRAEDFAETTDQPSFGVGFYVHNRRPIRR